LDAVLNWSVAGSDNRPIHRRTSFRSRKSRDGFQVTERWRIDAAAALIAVVAAQLASLVASEPPDLVKRCAGPACTLWFVDRTKAHSRLFCSATACGNRAKVAAFRERQRGSAGETSSRK
jgi:predicted RNA-binding Zn ribbon-like protein